MCKQANSQFNQAVPSRGDSKTQFKHARVAVLKWHTNTTVEGSPLPVLLPRQPAVGSRQQLPEAPEYFLPTKDILCGGSR